MIFNENMLFKSLIISFGLLLGLSCCCFIQISVAGYQLKSIDILSDIKTDTLKSVSEVAFVRKQFIDSCKSGLICFFEILINCN